jgi:hypothetical protein
MNVSSILSILKKPLFKADGLTVTVAIVLVVVIIFLVYKKMKRG